VKHAAPFAFARGENRIWNNSGAFEEETKCVLVFLAWKDNDLIFFQIFIRRRMLYPRELQALY
jgi:hypothetical protein